MEFIETPIFTRRIKEILADEEYRLLQTALVKNPAVGSVIPGTKGLRKLRWAVPGKGKSGGIRVIYYVYLDDERIYMLFPYKKSDQEDLTHAQMKILIEYVKEGVL